MEVDVTAGSLVAKNTGAAVCIHPTSAAAAVWSTCLWGTGSHHSRADQAGGKAALTSGGVVGSSRAHSLGHIIQAVVPYCALEDGCLTGPTVGTSWGPHAGGLRCPIGAVVAQLADGAGAHPNGEGKVPSYCSFCSFTIQATYSNAHQGLVIKAPKSQLWLHITTAKETDSD